MIFKSLDMETYNSPLGEGGRGRALFSASVYRCFLGLCIGIVEGGGEMRLQLFNVICDLLLNRRTATCNLLVK